MENKACIQINNWQQKTEMLMANTVYIHRNFGKKCVKFALQQQNQVKNDNFYDVPKKVQVRIK